MADGRSVSVVFRHGGAVIAVGGALLSTAWLFAALMPHELPLVIETHVLDQPVGELVFAGRTLDDWRELMKSVDLHDPERGQYVPGLIEIVQSPQVPWFTRRQAAQTLGRWGTASVAAVPVLEQYLEEAESDPDRLTSLWALNGLSLFGPLASPATASVSRMALDAELPVGHRLAVMECLSQIGIANPAAIAPLIQIAASNEELPILRRGAIEALGLFRGGAGVAVPNLLRILDETDTDLRREAAVALGRQGNAAEIAQPALFDVMVGDGNEAVRDAAGVALSQTGTAILPELIALLEAEDAELRWRGATVLGLFGRRAESAARPLQRLWDDPLPQVQIAALDASWKITGRGETIAVRAAHLLTESDRNVRRQAYLLLESLGPAAAPARDILAVHRHDSRSEIRQAVQKLLMRLPGDDR